MTGIIIQSTHLKGLAGSTSMTIGPDLHHKVRGMDIRQVAMSRAHEVLREIVRGVEIGHLSRDGMKILVIDQGRRPPMATDQVHRILSHVEDHSTEISTNRIVEDIVRPHHSPAVVVESRMASLGVRLQVGASHIENRLVSANQLLKMWLETVRKGMMVVRVVMDTRRQVDLETPQITMWILT
jgi:hypothetical protein